MTQAFQKKPREWVFEPSGEVQFASTPKQLPSLAVLQCLGTRVDTDIRFTIPAFTLGPQIKKPTVVVMDLETGRWVGEDGAVFDVKRSAISAGLADKAILDAKERLNTALCAPLDVHLDLPHVTLPYEMGVDTQRPPAIGSLREWRRTDAKWIKERSFALGTLDAPPRDFFDRAFDLVKQLDRPAELRWTYAGMGQNTHHICLRATKKMRHPLIKVAKSATGLGLDMKGSLSARDVQTQIYATQMLALAQTLRRFGGGDLGQVVISGFEVATFDTQSADRAVLQLMVKPGAWKTGLGAVTNWTASKLLSTPQTDLGFTPAESEDWVNLPDANLDPAQQESS